LDIVNVALSVALNVLKVALGLGFVIFIHELGHFIVAKWNGVKVEKFSIGFGPTLWGFRRGETEYVLAYFPLGGFVKMLGESPESEENRSTDPRAYPNKSVSARMAIISAGVIMNLLFGVACFTYVFCKEGEELAAVLGTVSAGSPAYEAGLRPYDEVVGIDHERDVSYGDLLNRVVLSTESQVLHFEVKRPGHEGLLELDIQPRREADMDRPTIGITRCPSLIIFDFEPPPGIANVPDYPRIEGKARESTVDVLVAAGPLGSSLVPLADFAAYERLLAKHAARPIVHSIERRLLASLEQGPPLKRFEITLPPNHFVDLGLRLTIEPCSAIRRDSPAEKAGFRKGDLIVKVDGRDDFDPMRLATLCFEHAGRPTTFEVERKSPSGASTLETLSVIPDDTPPRTEPILPNELFDVPGLGLCYPVTPHVVAVRAGSPAARAGMKPRDVINSITFKAPKPAGGHTPRPAPKTKTIEFDENTPGWVAAFAELQNRPIQEVELVVNKASSPVKLTPEPDPNWYNPARGLQFGPLLRKRPPQALAAALRSGVNETIENIGKVYATIRSLVKRRVAPKNLGGPILIATVAYGAAGSSFQDLISFLGFLSVNLAVLNFLPIPPLDGGQMVYLLAEKVRGRPLPDSAVIAGTYLGLFLVLCLMVYVTYQDVFRLVDGWF
jgi:regulator of sigma E protease